MTSITELTDEQIGDIYKTEFAVEDPGSSFVIRFSRAIIAADRAQRVPDADDILRVVCETDPADFNDKRNICISPEDLGDILRDALPSPTPAPLTQRMPEYLLGGMRFKVCVPKYRDGAEIIGIPEELNDRWVAFVAAENDCHMLSAAPQAQPERKPMSELQAIAFAGAIFPHSQHAKAVELIRAVEAFHGIKETP